MERLTEYHNGVAVIRDKSKLKEAMRKLAGYEDAEEDSDMEKITTEFAEYICDSLCKHPGECFRQETLDEICVECKMGKFICDILNTYNRLNTFVGSEVEKLMKKNAKLEKELQTYRNLEEQGLLLKLPCRTGDIIYDISTSYILSYKVESFKMLRNRVVSMRTSYIINDTILFSRSYVDDIGKTVFLTKAEAENALAETRCDNGEM